ncbi:hypothetical protein JCM11491_004136 [Sporobolomyces phaffii]
MECVGCTLDSPRQYYCPQCLRARLHAHHARKHQLRNALTLQSNRASTLLANGPSATATPSTRQLGFREESQLKALRWTLSVRLRDTRIATEQERVKVETLKAATEKRRAALNARRVNLSTARSLLSSLSSPSHPTSPALPLSLASLHAQVATLESSLSTVSDSLVNVRRILTLELVTTFSLKSIEPPLPDPFIANPSAATPPHATTTASFPPSYTLATVALPPLSLLPTLGPHALEAVLGHVAHLARLVALYEGVALPFVPVANCDGPGRAGVRSSPGASGWDGIVERPSSSAAAARGLANRRGPDEAGGGNPEEDDAATTSRVWPLGFGADKVKTARNGTERVLDPAATSRRDSLDTDFDARSFGRRGASRGGGGERGAGGRTESTVSSKRFKLVMTGAIALAYDLGFLCWTRETRRTPRGVDGSDWRVEDLDDLGKLVSRATGVELPIHEPRHDGTTRTRPRNEVVEAGEEEEDLDPFPSSTEPALSPMTNSVATLRASPEPAPDLSGPPTFPLSFSTVSEHYLALALASPPQTTTTRGGGKADAVGRSTTLGESSFVDAGTSTASGLGPGGGRETDDDEVDDDDDDDEWDLV